MGGGAEMPALRESDRVLVIDRKLFKADNTRFFVGVMGDYDGPRMGGRGFPFHLSPYEVSGAERHGEERVRIISLAAGDLIYLLPRNLDCVKLQMRRSP